LRGIVRDDAALEAAKRGEKSIGSIMEPGVQPVGPDTPVRDLFGLLAETTMPAPVVDDAGRLLGVVVRASLLQGLAESIGSNGNASTSDVASEIVETAA
jgi:glycine betaine/proline transport system ATP-binding protein